MNQREIKFRAWNKKLKCMSVVLELDFQHDAIRCVPGHLPKNKISDCVLMQYTGLKDKNGKGIYEGDVVNEFRISRSFPEGRNIQHLIKWDDNMTLDDSYGMTAVGFCMFGGELEIIGNIYENPDLI
jgi:uncharacterized phage protein (TIGR01671 family)